MTTTQSRTPTRPITTWPITTLRIACATAIAATAIGSASLPASAKGKCVRAGGEATMVTEDLAKFMANAALNNQIKANGWTASGPVKMTCKTEIGTHCVAHQRACK